MFMAVRERLWWKTTAGIGNHLRPALSLEQGWAQLPMLPLVQWWPPQPWERSLRLCLVPAQPCLPLAALFTNAATLAFSPIIRERPWFIRWSDRWAAAVMSKGVQLTSLAELPP